MTNLIERITDAIFRQEGMPANYTNPGNLRDCPWFPILIVNGKPWVPPLAKDPDPITRFYPSNGEYVQFSPRPRRFWIPRTRAEGIAGAAHVVALHIAEGDSLRKLIGIWAPPTDGNNTEAYIKNIAEWAAIPNPEVPLWNFIQDATT